MKALLQSHLFNLIVFSALVSAVFVILLGDDMKTRVLFALRAFSAFVLATLVLGWIMRPFPG